jgi:PAS domain-containing protein
MIDIIHEKNPTAVTVESLTDAYQRFAKALSAFSEFDKFSSALSAAVANDPIFQLDVVANQLQDKDNSLNIESAEQLFEMEKVMIPLGRTNPSGQFLKSDGKHSLEPFSAGDLHLLGSLANFISTLLACARNNSHNRKRADILQFLIDQLPLGVIGLESDGNVVMGNSLAWRLLKQPQPATAVEHVPELEALRDTAAASGEGHLEIDGQLLFAKRGLLTTGANAQVAVYLIYDLSPERQQLEQQLERAYYRGLCLQSPASFAMLQIEGLPGHAIRQLQTAIPTPPQGKIQVEAVDAYTAACLVEGMSQRELRALLRNSDTLSLPPTSRIAIGELADAENKDGKSFIETCQALLLPKGRALLAEFAVLEPYQPAFDALDMLLRERLQLQRFHDLDNFRKALSANRLDGAFIDLDATEAKILLPILDKSLDHNGNHFQLFYLSTRQPPMLADHLQQLPDAPLLCKPFDAEAILAKVDQHMALAT